MKEIAAGKKENTRRLGEQLAISGTSSDASTSCSCS
jgi:hypothetical protein